MPIEIRELIIKVKVEESVTKRNSHVDMDILKKTIVENCKKEVKKQLEKMKER